MNIVDMTDGKSRKMVKEINLGELDICDGDKLRPLIQADTDEFSPEINNLEELKIRWAEWVDFIEEALHRLSKVASLQEIYNETRNVCGERGVDIPKDFEAIIESAISRYCLASYKDADDERFMKMSHESYGLKR